MCSFVNQFKFFPLQAEERHVQSQRNSVAVQEAKFTIFKEFMESLFASFDPMVGVTSFVELSSGILKVQVGVLCMGSLILVSICLLTLA